MLPHTRKVFMQNVRHVFEIAIAILNPPPPPPKKKKKLNTKKKKKKKKKNY